MALFIVQENNGEEVITDVILRSETCYNIVGNRVHFSDDIFLDIGNDIEEDDICNDWTEPFCNYVTCDQLDGSVCHLSENDEECLGIFLVGIFDCKDGTCIPHDSY